MNCYELLKEEYKSKGDFNALVYGELSLSLSELLQYIDNVASFLSAEGMGKGSVVSLLLPNCAQVIIAFYALSKIGAVADFINPGEDDEVVAKELAETGAALLICRNDRAKVFKNIRTVKCCESDFARTDYDYDSFCGALNFSKKCESKNGKTDYVTAMLHSGGTDGAKKTVCLTNGNINSVTEKLSFIFSGSEYGEEKSLLVLPVSHSFGLVASLHLPLTNGLGICVFEKFTPQKIYASIEKDNISFMTGVPEMYSGLLSCKPPHINSLKNLRYIFCGGDFVNSELESRFNAFLLKYGSKTRLYTGYGLSETASVCCVNTDSGNKKGSVGKILDGVKMSIENPDGNGEGEITVEGPTVMKGYFPLNESREQMIVHTGDIGRIDEDGFVFILGRKKRLIVKSGYNLYPREMEKCVNSLDFVHNSCAVSIKKDGKIRIFLYLETDKTGDVLQTEIKSKIKAELGRHYLPDVIIKAKKLPLTMMGKIDYKLLEERSKTYEQTNQEA